MFDVSYITGKKAKALVDKGAMLVDVRDPVAYRDKAIAGSVNLSLRQISSLVKHPKNTKIVLVGDPTDQSTLQAASNYLINYGFTSVNAIKSIEAWYNS